MTFALLLVSELAAKFGPTPVGYVPPLIPLRLAFESVATPEAFVVALPTEFPLSVNAIDFPLTGEPPAVSVADSDTVPPKVPVAFATANTVLAWLTVCALVPALPL